MKAKLILLALGLVCTWGLVADVSQPRVEAQCAFAFNRCCLPAYAAPPAPTAACPVGRPCTIASVTSCSGSALGVAKAGVCNPETGSTCTICIGNNVIIGLPLFQCQVVQCEHPCYTRCEWRQTGPIACCASVQECGSVKCSTF